ncbi:hypothetical protein [Actibacterium sp. 188UL27-1]|uniref:hypothetical protein n=1 Tax=Actibacterium sp. 188UL27-1 TaxID=2786961 RepID=UPI00195B87EE|nr:hypothetical protein [Actibacterium sp. 188UL27-1]MBM7069123.1 hypothetical protein [Actibacterium sp. 188UL27-1]
MAGALTFAAAMAPLPLSAQSATPPPGCEAFLTIQYKGCLASIYWRCSAAPDGITWEATYGEDGPISVSTYNDEFQWLDTFFFFDGSRQRIADEGPKPASLSELLETGENVYDFTTAEVGPDGMERTQYAGIDRLTGDTKTVSGEELLITEFATVARDPETGEIRHTTEGNQYVLAEERLFLLGTDSWSENGVTEESDYSPVEILRPGDKTFGKTKPRYECGAVDL